MPKPQDGPDVDIDDPKVDAAELKKFGTSMPPYRLPLDPGSGWAVGKGNWDDPGGGHGVGQAYAFDIEHYDKASGWNVRAARAGYVVTFRNDVTVNTSQWTDKDWAKIPESERAAIGGGNAILIRHADDTVAAYCHLMPHQNFVTKIGQWIAQGQVIGLADNMGNSFGPHLHIDVRLFWNTGQDLGPTLPIEFHDANHGAWRPRDAEPLLPDNSRLFQEYWRWCHRCQGLFYGGKPISGTVGGSCPAGGGHEGSSSANYVLAINSAVPSGQHGWRWCQKCQGLFFGDNPGSVCPADKKEHHIGGGDYNLVLNAPDAPGQYGWRWCQKCQGLFFGDNPGSVCPADNKNHKPGSGHYILWEMRPDSVQQHWRWCQKCQGLFFGDNPGSMCPADKKQHNIGSASYILSLNAPDAPGQQHWRWCQKCQGLFFGDNPGSVCPADNKEHHIGSGNYTLVLNRSDSPGQQHWRWCQKCQGLFFGDNSGSKCPAGGQHHVGTGNYTLLTDKMAT